MPPALVMQSRACSLSDSDLQWTALPTLFVTLEAYARLVKLWVAPAAQQVRKMAKTQQTPLSDLLP